MTTAQKNNELTMAQQLAVIHEQIREWQRARYNAVISHRVHTSIGSPKETLDAIMANLAQAEKALDVLNKLLAEMQETR